MSRKGTRNAHPRNLWTPDEDLIIRRLYRQLGSEAVARVLTKRGKPRTWHAVATRARKVITTIIPKGHTSLVDVYPYYRDSGANGAHHYTVTAARKDGVLRTFHTDTGLAHAAPTEWVDSHALHLEQEFQRERELRDWLTTPQLAETMGVTPEHIRGAMSKDRALKIRHYLADIRRAQRPLRHRAEYMWHPDDARVAAREYRRRRPRATKAPRLHAVEAP